MAEENVHPTDLAPIIRWGRGAPEVVELRWGLKARDGSGPQINVSAESVDVASHRCLIPATEFDLFSGAGHPRRRWRVTLRGEEMFFFAGVWNAADDGWPESFAAITIEAAEDLKALTDRQLAVIRPSDGAYWLTAPERVPELLKPLPVGSFDVKSDEGS